jgi:hypothetical protein
MGFIYEDLSRGLCDSSSRSRSRSWSEENSSLVCHCGDIRQFFLMLHHVVGCVCSYYVTASVAAYIF